MTIFHNLDMEKDDVKPLVNIDGKQLRKAPLPKITAPTGGGTIDTEARTAINSLITALEKLGVVRNN